MNIFLKNIIHNQPLDGDCNDNREIIIDASFYLISKDHLNDADIDKLRHLESLKGPKWVFSKSLGIDFLALSAIAKHKPEIINGRSVANILNRLTSLEEQEGGPYFDSLKDRHIDIGTNAAIACFLQLQNVTLPNLDRLFAKWLTDENNVSKLFSREQIKVLLCCGKPAASLKKSIVFSPEEEAVMRKISGLLKKRTEFMSADIQTLAVREVKNTIRNNPDKQMSLISFFIWKSLRQELQQKIPESLIAELGLANILFWTAFIIYDDFWDEDEMANPQVLPVANFYAREYVRIFGSIFTDKEFDIFFHQMMDALDGANTWENVCCRTQVKGGVFHIPQKLPNYEDFVCKFYPASGNIFGPLAIIHRLGYSVRSEEVQVLIGYFRNFLIAMQLNDDMHDWQEDLLRGNLSTAVTALLEDYLEKHPDRREIDLEKDMEELQRIAWFETLPKICHKVLEFVQTSEACLNKLAIFDNTEHLQKFININRNIALEGLSEHRNSMDFLNEFEC